MKVAQCLAGHRGKQASLVFDGPFMSRGMPDFTGRLDNKDVEKLKAFIQGTADAVRAQQQQQKEK